MTFLHSEVRRWVRSMQPSVPSSYALAAKPRLYVRYGDEYLSYLDSTCSDNGPRNGAGRGPHGGSGVEEDGGKEERDWDEAWLRLRRQKGETGQRDRRLPPPPPEERPAEDEDEGAFSRKGRRRGAWGAGGDGRDNSRERCSQLDSSKWVSFCLSIHLVRQSFSAHQNLALLARSRLPNTSLQSFKRGLWTNSLASSPVLSGLDWRPRICLESEQLTE